MQPAVVRHTPVLVEEVLDSLDAGAGGAYIDCTAGEGGHAEAVLNRAAGGARLLGIDLDGEALETARRRLGGYGERAVLAEGSFRDLRELASGRGFVPANGVLMDLGVSSLQLDSAPRGFSFSRSGRLDMRFGASQRTTAHDVVNGESESGLAEIIRRYGEEKRPMRIARAIAAARPIETTVELAEVVSSAVGGRRGGGVHPATRTFQAVRMAVNEELQNLEQGLEQAGGRTRARWTTGSDLVPLVGGPDGQGLHEDGAERVRLSSGGPPVRLRPRADPEGPDQAGGPADGGGGKDKPAKP